MKQHGLSDQLETHRYLSAKEPNCWCIVYDFDLDVACLRRRAKPMAVITMVNLLQTIPWGL